MSADVASKRDVDNLLASTSHLRVRVEALRRAARTGDLPQEVTDATLQEIRGLADEVRPMWVVAQEFQKRWKHQRTGLLVKREAEIEYHLRQGSEAQLARMEEEAEDQLESMEEEAQRRRRAAAEKLHRTHRDALERIVVAWRRGLPEAKQVKDTSIAEAVAEALDTVCTWALREEGRLLEWWEEELGRMLKMVHHLDQDELNSMEGAQYARCALMESTVERQQHEYDINRSELQNELTAIQRRILWMGSPDDHSPYHAAMSSKVGARRRIQATVREVEEAAQMHEDMVLRYVDEVAAWEQSRVNAIHTTMAQALPKLGDMLKDRLVRKLQSIASGNDSYRPPPGRKPPPPPDDEAQQRLLLEIRDLQQEVKIMMGHLGRNDWRRHVQEEAERALDGLRHTEAALVASNMQPERRGGGLKSGMAEALRSIEWHSEDLGDRMHAEFTRMRNAKVALSLSRSGRVRAASQRYEWDAVEADEEILPAISRLAHEVEVMRQMASSSKGGERKMPVYMIAACWRRALQACYPVARRLWDASHLSESQRRAFVANLLRIMAVEPTLQDIITTEQKRLEATLPAPSLAHHVRMAHLM